MAVSKIRKISSWTLIACTVISLVVFALFFFGGVGELYKGEFKTPNYTGLVLNWMYILFIVAAVSAVLFGIWQFISVFKTNPKGGMMGLAVLVLFAGMLFVTFTIGNGEKLPIMGEDIQKYNVPFWLKTADMWLYSTYVLIVLIVLAMIGGSVKKIMNK
ncbi:MAG: hypothetical protein LBV72_00205 [Tannerella sp.]|jgi:magnesium-transporting ATPase (P-type)|nr:hypothetical protein [Tannerella sp.]